MTKTDAQWLMNEYWPNRELGVTRQTIQMFTRVINIIREQNNPIPSCSCQWRTNALIAKSLYEQNQTLIEKTATTNVKKRQSR